MQIIKLRLKKYSYDIVIGNNIIHRLPNFIQKLKIGASAYIITNAAIKNKYGRMLQNSLEAAKINTRFRLIPDTEKSKSINMAADIIKDIVNYNKKKVVFIIAFGGGVVGDLAGFVASIYKRGVPYIQIPTTLLAQVDSSIGGKTGVDLAQGKNLVGAFYQPRLVFSDVRMLRTLALRQIRSGLAEIIKYAIIKDKALFGYLENNCRDILNLKTSSLEFIVKRSSTIKAGIVQQDEREEEGIRTALNFGHTIGHAIEAAGGYNKYNHGEAVSLGMLAAADISYKIGLVNKDITIRIENLIKNAGLPNRIRNIPIAKIIKAHYQDKKFIGPKNRLVLIKGIGKTKIAVNVPLKIINDVLRQRCL